MSDQNEAKRPVNPRLLAPRLLLDALDAPVLRDVVRRPIETPFLLGGDAGARIMYEGPPPFEHVFEYLDGAAQGWSHDDPAGPYEAQLAARPDHDLTAYLDALYELCAQWNLLRRPHGAFIAYAHIHTAAARGDAASGRTALDALYELCAQWNLLRRPHGAFIAYAHIHTAAARGDAASGRTALDALADTSTATPEERATAEREAGERVAS